MPQNGEYSLYFHIPFCKRKCGYCHFYVIPDEERFQALFMEALKQEWDLCSPYLSKEDKLISIYFGGGTPSLLGPERIETILSWIAPSKNVEVTLEANPESLPPFRGVNRMSLGVQSFDNHLLTTLTRRHKAQQAKTSVERLIRFGIENISIDLMYDIPGQTLKSWEATLDLAASLPISHLSLYNLTIEPHTSFYKNRKQLQPKIPSSEMSLKMLEMAIEKLEAAGFRRYEISAFAKPGFESKHNTGYWKGRPFLGLGPSAFSYWNHARYRNSSNLNRYAKKLKDKRSSVDFYEKLSPLEQLKEKLAIRLRLLEPMKEWPRPLEGICAQLRAKGFLERASFKLSEKGLLFHDTVAEIILQTSVRAH